MAYTWQEITAGAWSGHAYWSHSSKPRADSYLVWADATGFTDLASDPGEVQSVPLLIELREGQTAKQWAHDVAGLRFIVVPALYAHPPAGLERSRFCTAHVTREFFAKVGRMPLLRDAIERFEVGLPGGNLPPRTPLGKVVQRAGGRRKAPAPAAIVATIDDNLAFAHARFREPGASPRTRVEFFWDQGDATQELAPGAGYGRELTRERIEALMAQASVDGHVDEERLYRLAEYRGVRLRLGHGTHVMDLAAGEEPGDLDADAPRHIWVQFPGRDNWGASPLGVHVIDGLRYIVHRADVVSMQRWGGPALAPIVVNLPHANLGGPHDGRALVEAAMEELITLRSEVRTLDIVLPAGNNHLSRCHAHFDLAPSASQALEWRVLPDDATPNFLEIWPRAEEDADHLEITVQPPGAAARAGVAARRFTRGDVFALRGASGIVCTVVFAPLAGNGDRPMALVTVGPSSTHRRPAQGEPAPEGVWTVTVTNRSKRSKAHIEAWIQRDDPVLGRPRYGRQSHFEDARYQRFLQPSGMLNQHDHPEDAIVKRAGAINGIATGLKPVVVGGFLRDNGHSAAYAGRAHEGDTQRYPDAAAPSDESWNRRGILAAGTRSGTACSMDGTSVATAQVARELLARRLSELKPLEPGQFAPHASPGLSHGRSAAQQLAEEQEMKHPWPSRKLVPTREGKGRINVPPLVPHKPRGP